MNTKTSIHVQEQSSLAFGECLSLPFGFPDNVQAFIILSLFHFEFGEFKL